MTCCKGMLVLVLMLPGCGANDAAQRERIIGAFDARELTGAFVAYDASRSRWFRHGTDRCVDGVLPASTFKIWNALIALDCGVADGADYVIPWDGVTRDIPAWNQDHTLASALRVSAVPYYQELARRIGAERMADGLRRLKYGNGDMSAGIDRFWLEGGMRITPEQQVTLLRRLHDGTLPFHADAMATVRGMLRQQTDGDGPVLYGKTGWATSTEINAGWFVGWVECPGGPVYFATLVLAKRPIPANFLSARKEIALECLQAISY